ncbi:hypothetical protein ABPG74_019133 [Tetrahymena malaccensis]
MMFTQNNYCLKAVRKQLVCYLILRFFEVYEQCQIPSFYELWNYCFPDEIQKKKKRSKFDNKQQISQKINSDTIQAEFSHHSECVVNSKAYFCTNNQNYKIIQKQILDNSQNFSILLQFLNNTDLPLVEASYPSLSNKQTISQTIQKKEINNGIISDDEESGENHMTNCSQMCIYDKQLNKQNEKWYENADENELKKTNQCQYLYEQQDQNQFYYQNFYQDLPQIQNEQIIDLNYQNTGGISNLEFPLSYKIQRTIRKQFVCYLILHYFEQNDHSEIPSFYELWNICFPEEIQTKKKLSKFDKKNQIKKQVIFKEDEPSINSEDLVNSSNLLSASNQNYNSNIEPLDDPQIITSSIYFINKFHSALNELKTNENCFKNTQIAIISTQKIQINNGIISDGDDEDDQKYNAKYQQINNSNQQKDVNYHQLIEKQQSEQDQYLYEYQYQNLFCQVNQNLQNFDLHYQYTNESNYKFNDQYIYFPNYNQC